MIIPVSLGYYMYKWVISRKGLRTDSGSSKGRYVLTILSLILFQLAQASRNGMGSRTRLFWEDTRFHTNPSPFCVQTAAHTGLGTGIFFTVTLVLGAIALAAYSYFRLNRRTIGFQHFEVRMRKMGTRGWGSSLQPSP